MSKSLSSSPPAYRKGLSGVKGGAKGPDRKRLALIGISIVLGIIVLLILAVFAYGAFGNRGPAATPTPVPTAEPTPEPTPTPVPTPTPTPVPSPGQAYSNDGPFLIGAFVKGSTGEGLVKISLSPGATTVDVNKLTMSIVCEGNTYANVWSLKAMDWASNNNNTILEPDESIVASINTKTLGIPQGKIMTIMVLKNGDVMQKIAVAPSNT